MKKQLNEQFTRMQKLAGIISKEELIAKIEEAKKNLQQV